MITLTSFAPIVAIGVLGLLVLAYKMHTESMGFITDLQFFLRHRIISHNRVKAQLAVLRTQHEKLKQENLELKTQVSHSIVEQPAQEFTAEIHGATFVEDKKAEIEKLEHEISSIQSALSGDFKEQLSNYLKEVDGLSQRLSKAKMNFVETSSNESDSVESNSL